MKTLIASVSTLLLSANVSMAEPRSGMTDLSFEAAWHGRAVEGAVWYPATTGGTAELFGENPVFHGVEVLRDASLAPGAYPVVLLSHGLGGNIRSQGWLAAGLAERGAIVVAVNHPNSTSRDFDMLRGLDHGTRARDLSAALDWLEADPRFSASIDHARVMAAGFSFGGWTALSLGGVTGDLDAYTAHCADAGTKSTHCADIAREGIDLSSLNAATWNASYADPRVTAIAAIDPALHWGLTAENIAALRAPALLIGLGEGIDRLFATDFTASGFDKLLPAARPVILSPASHFAAIGLCKPAGAAILAEEGEVYPICTDTAGADRSRLHAQIIDLIASDLGL